MKNAKMKSQNDLCDLSYASTELDEVKKAAQNKTPVIVIASVTGSGMATSLKTNMNSKDQCYE